MAQTVSIVDDVKDVVVATLSLQSRADTIEESTPLLGAVPELDSMAVMELLVALEQRFGVTIADDDVSGDIFETLGTLAAFVSSKLPA
jgi:acyl carrier protein